METIQKKQDLHEIIRKIKAGERIPADQFSHIFNVTKNIIRKAVVKKAYNITPYEREILVQDITTKILAVAKLEKYNPDYSYNGFVYRSAINALIDNHRRTSKFKSELSIDVEPEYETQNYTSELISTEPDPSETLFAKERCALLKRVFKQGLTRSERHILLAIEFGGVSPQKLSKELHVSVNCLYLKIHRIKAKILKYITVHLKLRKEDLY